MIVNVLTLVLCIVRSEFHVVMSVAISAYKRCSVRIYIQLFVGGLMFYLRWLCCLRIVVSNTYICIVLCFCFVFFVLCTLCCQFLWICFVLLSSSCVPYATSFSGFVFVLLSSSCVPYVASFSGFVLLCCLRLVYHMLPVSLDCLCMIAL